MPMSDNARGAIYMNIAMLAFTLNDTCMKAVSETLPLFQAIALRGVFSTVALATLAVVTGALVMPRGRALASLSLRTLAEIGGTVFFLGALTQMPLANLSAIMQSMPLAVTLAAAVFFRERVSPAQLAAILIGMGGVLLIIRPGTDGFDIWAVMGLASVACVVVRDLSTRAMPASLPSVIVAVFAAAAVALTGLFVTLVRGWQPVSLHELALVVGAAVFLVVGYLSVVKMMRVGSIAAIAPFRYTALIWALLLGWMLFGTFPDHLTLIGAGIVVATGLFTLYHGGRQGRIAAVPPESRLKGARAGR